MNGRGTCLVYHIDKSLGVVPTEAVDHVTLILTREDRLDQRRKQTWGKHSLDRTLTIWRGVWNEEWIGGQLALYGRSVKWSWGRTTLGDGARGGATGAGGKLKRGAVNLGYGLTDDIGELGHKAEAVGGGVEEMADGNGYLNLVRRQCQGSSL